MKLVEQKKFLLSKTLILSSLWAAEWKSDPTAGETLCLYLVDSEINQVYFIKQTFSFSLNKESFGKKLRNKSFFSNLIISQ